MRMRTSLLAGCAAAILSLGALPAVAADVLPPEPSLYEPPPPPVFEVAERSCLYARVDGGYSFNDRPSVTTHSLTFEEDVDDSWFVEGGFGCRITPYFRADVTVSYRDSHNFSDEAGTLDADVMSVTGMVNGYWDIANFNGITPYVGAGVGVSANTIDNVSLPAGLSTNTIYDFAYALMAGVSFDVSDRLTVDAGYRFTELGAARSDGGDRIRYHNINAHDIRVGLRYNFE